MPGPAELDPAVRSVLERMLDKDPAQRITARDLEVRTALLA